VRIRPARPSDLRHLARIEDEGVAIFAEHFGDALPPAFRTPAPSGVDRQLAGTLLVAEADGAVVGFAHLTFPDGFAHLEQLDVLTSHRRQGIGSALVRAAMEEARWAGADRLSLCTYRDLPWNGPFYARLGFTEKERLEPFQARLRAHERELGLDAAGARTVMEVALDPGR
jgi:GNAT superfamily N-acetyltransferase